MLVNKILEQRFEKILSKTCTTKIPEAKLFWNRKIKLDFVNYIKEYIETEQCVVSSDKVNSYLKSQNTNFIFPKFNDRCFFLVLWNIFKSEWIIPFDPDLTIKKLFNNKVKVDMMCNMNEAVHFFINSDVTVVVKYLTNGSIIFIKTNDTLNFETDNVFDPSPYKHYNTNSKTKIENVDLYIPKFKKESVIDYTEKYDVSNITDSPDNFAIVQKNYIEMDEQGVKVESLMYMDKCDGRRKNCKIIEFNKPFYIYVKDKYNQVIIEGIIDF